MSPQLDHPPACDHPSLRCPLVRPPSPRHHAQRARLPQRLEAAGKAAATATAVCATRPAASSRRETRRGARRPRQPPRTAVRAATRPHSRICRGNGRAPLLRHCSQQHHFRYERGRHAAAAPLQPLPTVPITRRVPPVGQRRPPPPPVAVTHRSPVVVRAISVTLTHTAPPRTWPVGGIGRPTPATGCRGARWAAQFSSLPPRALRRDAGVAPPPMPHAAVSPFRPHRASQLHTLQSGPSCRIETALAMAVSWRPARTSLRLSTPPSF